MAGVICSCFQESGKIPETSAELNICEIGSDNSIENADDILQGITPAIVDDIFFIFLILQCIPWDSNRGSGFDSSRFGSKISSDFKG